MQNFKITKMRTGCLFDTPDQLFEVTLTDCSNPDNEFFISVTKAKIDTLEIGEYYDITLEHVKKEPHFMPTASYVCVVSKDPQETCTHCGSTAPELAYYKCNDCGEFVCDDCRKIVADRTFCDYCYST